MSSIDKNSSLLALSEAIDTDLQEIVCNRMQILKVLKLAAETEGADPKFSTSFRFYCANFEEGILSIFRKWPSRSVAFGGARFRFEILVLRDWTSLYRILHAAATLTTLSIGSLELVDIVPYSAMFSNALPIRSLTLSDIADGFPLSIFLRYLHCPFLEYLELNACRVTKTAAINEYSPHAFMFPALLTLVIHGHLANDDFTTSLLARSPLLKTLYLYDCHKLTPTFTRRLMTTLGGLLVPELQKLGIHYCRGLCCGDIEEVVKWRRARNPSTLGGLIMCFEIDYGLTYPGLSVPRFSMPRLQTPCQHARTERRNQRE